MMLRQVFLALALSSSALAQEMTAEDCTALMNDVEGTLSALSVSFSAPGLDAGRCVMSGLARPASGKGGIGWHVDQVLVSGTSLAGGYAETKVLDSVAVEMRGLTFTPAGPTPEHLTDLLPYLRDINASIGLNRSEGDDSLQVSRLLVDLAEDSRIDLTARLINADLSDLARAPFRLAGLLVTDADLKITSRGLFAALVAAALGPEAAGPQERDDAILAMQAEATSWISQLPEPAFSLGSKSALRTLVADLPDPQGTLRLQLQTEQGLGPVSFAGVLLGGAPMSVTDLAPILEGVRVDVAWPRALGQ